MYLSLLPSPFHVPLLTPIFLSFFQTPQAPPRIDTQSDIEFHLEESDLLPSLEVYSELMGPDFVAEVDWLASSLQPTDVQNPWYEPTDDVLEL